MELPESSSWYSPYTKFCRLLKFDGGFVVRPSGCPVSSPLIEEDESLTLTPILPWSCPTLLLEWLTLRIDSLWKRPPSSLSNGTYSSHPLSLPCPCPSSLLAGSTATDCPDWPGAGSSLRSKYCSRPRCWVVPEAPVLAPRNLFQGDRRREFLFGDLGTSLASESSGEEETGVLPGSATVAMGTMLAISWRWIRRDSSTWLDSGLLLCGPDSTGSRSVERTGGRPVGAQGMAPDVALGRIADTAPSVSAGTS